MRRTKNFSPGIRGRAEAAFSIPGLTARMTNKRIGELARPGIRIRQNILRGLG